MVRPGRRFAGLLCAAVLASGLALTGASTPGAAETAPDDPSLPGVRFELVGRYETGGGETTAEITAFADDRLYVTNGSGIDVVDLSDPTAPVELDVLSTAGASLADPTSVASSGDLVAVAVPNATKTSRGVVQIFVGGQRVDSVQVGALPDMVTMTPDGTQILVANEGEPNSYGQPDSIDPEGSVSIISALPYHFHGKVPARTADLLQRTLQALFPPRTVSFESFNEGRSRHGELPPGVRIFGPGATVAEDLEPEYITTDGRTAWVSLQENNAVAAIDLRRARVSKIVDLGTKDHSLPQMGLDASDRDGGINIQPWPVRGMFMPDAIASYNVGRDQYLVTANEGDARDYEGYEEEERARSIAIEPEAADNAKLGRLTVTTAPPAGDTSRLYSFGARSFSIFTPDGELVFDSGDDFEQIVADTNPAWFNSNNDEDSFDDRSDNKGPEPEGVAVGRIGSRQYAFVGLERVGGVMVYDISDPTKPVFQQYLTSREFGTGTLTLLHNNDGESTIQPITVGQVANPALGFAGGVRVSETNGGNLITDDYLRAYDTYAAAAAGLPPRGPGNPVIAVQNGGGIRQNAGNILPVGTTFNLGDGSQSGVPGPISRRNTLDVLAFLTNTMTVVNDVAPAELTDILEWSASSLPTANGKFLQVAGIEVVYDTSGTPQVHSAAPPGEQAGSIVTPGSRVVSATLADGTPLIADGVVLPGAPSVRIVTNSVSAIGGDNYPTFEDTPARQKVNLGLTYEQSLVEYLGSFAGVAGLPTIPATDARYADPDGEGRISIDPEP